MFSVVLYYNVVGVYVWNIVVFFYRFVYFWIGEKWVI